MQFRILLPVAIVAAALAGASAPAAAKNGNKKSALIGAAAGVAVGAGAVMLYNRSQQGAQPQAQQREYTGSTRPVSYQTAPQQSCATRPVKLFDESGNYVKTERMRVCN